ncbi:MAG: hypothetical protein IJ231_11030 [Clostridia bacterium]|nr:hypothetical protein [Clostridia bacterium]
MAQITLKHLVIAPLNTETDGAEPTYGNGMKVGHLMQANISWNRGNVRLDGDDHLVDRDNSITSGTLTINTTYMDRAARSALLDYRTAGASTGEYILGGKGSPYVGTGYVWKDNLEATKPFKAYWYYKVQYGLNEEMKTKGESTEYGTPSIEGEVMGVLPDASMETGFRKESDFATEAEAIAWVDALGHVTP